MTDLTKRNRKIMEMRKDGITVREIAGIMGMKRDTVSSVIHRETHPRPSRVNPEIAIDRNKRHLEYIRLREEGRTLRYIADKHGVAVSTVYKVVNRKREKKSPQREHSRTGKAYKIIHDPLYGDTEGLQLGRQEMISGETLESFVDGTQARKKSTGEVIKMVKGSWEPCV